LNTLIRHLTAMRIGGGIFEIMTITSEIIATALDGLAERDCDIARVLRAVGYPAPRHREPGFGTFVNIIIGQQVSVASATAIRGRLMAAAAGPLTPQSMLALDDDALKAVGLSRRKMEYCRLLAGDIIAGRFDPGTLDQLDDAAITAAIVQRKGLGQWSADIYALFALGRADIWPVDDLAVVVAVQRLRNLDARPDRAAMARIAEDWRPWRGIVALLMWHHYNNAAL
jgi:DNA-3-methyladenine glycosylase II